MRISATILVLVASGWAGCALAQDEKTYDRVDLSAAATAEIDNDLLIATVFAEVEDNDQEDAADSVNAAIAWAAERARDVPDIRIQTMNYSTRPLYANGRRIVGWSARQALRLESEDAEALSTLLGELQDRVAIQSINYDVSDAARNAAEEVLIAEALAQFNRRAELVAGELDRPGFRIVRLSIGTPFGGPVRMLQQEAVFATAARAAPELESGTQTIQVSVNGTIELSAAP
jgi:predicted secreted protein